MAIVLAITSNKENVIAPIMPYMNCLTPPIIVSKLMANSRSLSVFVGASVLVNIESTCCAIFGTSAGELARILKVLTWSLAQAGNISFRYS